MLEEVRNSTRSISFQNAVSRIFILNRFFLSEFFICYMQSIYKNIVVIKINVCTGKFIEKITIAINQAGNCIVEALIYDDFCNNEISTFSKKSPGLNVLFHSTFFFFSKSCRAPGKCMRCP